MFKRILPSKNPISLKTSANHLKICNRKKLQHGFSFYTTSASIKIESPDVKDKPKATKINLIGMSRSELKGVLGSLYPSIQDYNVQQIWKWLYEQGQSDFSQMSNLSKGFREILIENFFVSYGTVETSLTSKDGTMKRLISFTSPNKLNASLNSKNGDKAKVEVVMIPESNRRTLCVSSQIGCSLNCTFCHTGTQKLLRNLTSGEIVGQYMGFAHLLKDLPVKPLARKKLSNIVFMGQGEPLYNHRNVFNAIKILTDPKGIDFPKGKITVSTSGVVPLIPRLASELGVNLAVSLHAVTDDIRNEIVPINKQFNIKSLLESCHQFVQASQKATNRITFEYVMLKGVNDSSSDARELARILKRFPAHVNLIPFNPWPGCGYECTDIQQIKAFAETLALGRIPTTIRFSRGQDIMAACGQLKSLDMTKESRK